MIEIEGERESEKERGRERERVTTSFIFSGKIIDDNRPDNITLCKRKTESKQFFFISPSIYQ
jgi:hypothetical protein